MSLVNNITIKSASAVDLPCEQNSGGYKSVQTVLYFVKL